VIISHKHKFIFMKTRKTAGTSIQVALSRICGSDDIITGTCINDEGIMDESHSSGKNIDKFFTNHPHPPLIQVKQFLGEDVWDSYFKFGFVRNPYEIAVSRYFWEKRGKEKNVVKCGIDEFREWSKTNLKDYDWMHTYTALNGVVDLDYIGRYENLVEDFGYICDKIGLKETQLPSVKAGYRDKKHYSMYYDEETKSIVNNFFNKDINLFGYDFNPEFVVSRIGPIITQNLSADNNINGPSLIKVPTWIKNPLGKYYLYFAHHKGDHIRLAYSDSVDGDWKIHNGGTLKLEDSACIDHIASPDVHVDDENKRIVMYYHGKVDMDNSPHNQCSFLALSNDGLDFTTNDDVLGMFYFRVFKYNNKFYALAKNKNVDGILYESKNGITDFKPIFNLIPNVRHTSVLVESDFLYIYYTIVGDSPESIMMCKIKLAEDVNDWEVLDGQIILRPELNYEGAKLPKARSTFGASFQPTNQVRDPYVFKDDHLYLLYSLAGENGIGLAKLHKVKGDYDT